MPGCRSFKRVSPHILHMFMSRSGLSTFRALASGLTLGLLVACNGGKAERDDSMRVERVFRSSNDGSQPLVFLNQDVTVYFSDDLDGMSVSEDTFRIVDENGNRVPGVLRPGTRSVTFEVIPPVKATLDDGSFAPDRAYRLEIAGMPLWNAIRSKSGARLSRGLGLDFRTVPADPSGDVFNTPFLPEGQLTDSFEWFEPYGRSTLHVAAETGRLLLHFNLPILPSSVTPNAVQVNSLLGGEREVAQPKSVRILPSRSPDTSHYGSTLELRFEPGALDPTALHFVIFAEKDGLLDYSGRPLQTRPEPIQVRVVAGDRERILDLPGSTSWGPLSDVPGAVPFAQTGSRIEPLARLEAGDGRLGSFRPRKSTTIRLRRSFDRGDGRRVEGSGDFHFSDIDIPEGVEVRVESSTPITIRSAGSVRIRGRLVLATPLVETSWSHGDRIGFASLLRASGCALIAGGAVRVDGTVEHARGDEAGSPFSVLCGGDLVVRGRLPAETVLGVDPARRIVGALESPVRVECPMTPGLTRGAEFAAESWTAWTRLPPGHPTTADIELVDPRGALDVVAQVAPPHSVDPSRPDLAAHRVSQPTPVGEAVELVPGSFVRFRVQAFVCAGQPLPSLGGIRLLAH